jgi:hypothetical protein
MLYFLTAECPDNKAVTNVLSEFHKIIFLNKLKIVEALHITIDQD